MLGDEFMSTETQSNSIYNIDLQKLNKSKPNTGANVLFAISQKTWKNVQLGFHENSFMNSTAHLIA